MKIEIPTTCPCCNYELEIVNEQLFCRNPACDAQLNKKIEHFCKVMGIKGFGPATVEATNLQDIPELYFLTLEELVDSIGSEKTAKKLLNEIEKSKGADLATVLMAFSIPLVGKTASSKIASVVGSIEEITQETCRIAGLGDKVTSKLLGWINFEYPEIKEFLPFSFKSNPCKYVDTDGPSVCITGKLSSFKTKAEAYDYLISCGFKVVESVTKTLDYLVDEDNKGSSKRKKAEEYGVTIISNLKDLKRNK